MRRTFPLVAGRGGSCSRKFVGHVATQESSRGSHVCPRLALCVFNSARDEIQRIRANHVWRAHVLDVACPGWAPEASTFQGGEKRCTAGKTSVTAVVRRIIRVCTKEELGRVGFIDGTEPVLRKRTCVVSSSITCSLMRGREVTLAQYTCVGQFGLQIVPATVSCASQTGELGVMPKSGWQRQTDGGEAPPKNSQLTCGAA